MDSSVNYPNVSGYDESYEKGPGVVSVPYQHKVPVNYSNNIQNQYYQNIAPPVNNYNYPNNNNYYNNNITNNNVSNNQPVSLEVSNNNKQPIGDGSVPFAKCDPIEKQIRIGFIRKVYALLFIQLAITFGAVCLTFIKKVREFLDEKFWIFYIAAGIALIVIIIMCCSRKATVKVPWNYILLLLWTISVAYMVMTSCAYYDKEIVITAIGLTVGISVGLTIYACITKTDYTYCGGILSCAVFIFILYGMFGWWFGKWVYFIYCGIGAFIFSLYLIYDTQKVLGKFRVKYSIDDYACAALDLYMDVVNLFLSILSMTGVTQN